MDKYHISIVNLMEGYISCGFKIVQQFYASYKNKFNSAQFCGVCVAFFNFDILGVK